MKPCPYCAELIQDQAAKCRYCGEWLDPSKRPAWSGDEATPSPSIPAAAPVTTPPPPSEPPSERPTGSTLPVGSGLPELTDLGPSPEPARSWSAPAWLANAQAARSEPAAAEPVVAPEPTPEPAPERSKLEEVALRMERIRQSAAAVRESDPEPAGDDLDERADLDVEPGVTLPAGSLRAVGLEERESRRAAQAADRVTLDDGPTDRRRTRQRRRRDEARAEIPTVPDMPRDELLDELDQADRRRKRKDSKRSRRDERDDLDALEDDDLEPPTDRRRGRRAAEPAAPLPPSDYDDEEDDDWDDEPAPRRAGPGGFDDDDFLDDDDDDDYDDDDYGDDDFGDMGSAPRPMPWKPILLASAVIVVLGVVFFSDYLFPSDGETDAAAESEGDSEAGETGDAAEPAAPDDTKQKAAGEGQPVEPEATGGEQPAAAEAGAAAETPKPAAAAPNADTVAKLEEARKAYTKAGGKAKKLAPVEEMLKEILTAAPNNPDALTLMAQVHLEQGKFDESLATATQCSTVSPESADCWLTIGVIQEEVKKDKEAAKAAYQKYLDLAPEGRYAKAAKQALKRIK